MTTSLRLSEEAVIGSTKYSLSEDALSALQSGDTKALIASHRDRFGGWRMEKDDDEDEDEDEDDDSEDGDEDEDSDDDSDDDDDEDSPEGKKSKKAADKDDSPEGLKKKVAALEDEKNRLYRGREKARKERDDALAEVEKIKKDAPGDDDLKKTVEKQEATIKDLQTKNQNARLEIAFLADNTYEWVNPGQALKLADLSDVEIDDDGKVHGLVSALEALATSSPHLLKPKATRKKVEPKPGPSGQRPAKKSTSKEKAEQDRVAAKYNIKR